jgi:hypothetical protein
MPHKRIYTYQLLFQLRSLLFQKPTWNYRERKKVQASIPVPVPSRCCTQIQSPLASFSQLTFGCFTNTVPVLMNMEQLVHGDMEDDELESLEKEIRRELPQRQ